MRRSDVLTFLVLTVAPHVDARIAVGDGAFGHRGIIPVALAIGVARHIDVVDTRIDRHIGQVGEVGGKKTGHVMATRSSTNGSVAKVAIVVFSLQVHVHHILLLLHVLVHEAALVCGSVIHLDVVYSVVWQVVE